MSFSKKMLAFAAVSALTAATAVPAMALENEFHGMYRVRGSVTNFQNVGLVPATTGLVPKEDGQTMTQFEQRARIMYIAKANDDLKLVSHFEIDSSWGDAAYQSGQRGTGAAIGGDNINLETKNLYLDFKIPSTPVKAMVGLQGFTDSYKGIFLSDDVAGAVLSGKGGAATLTGAFFRLNDKGGANTIGRANVDLYVLDGKFAVTKDVSVGGSYYGAFNDMNISDQTLHTFGLNAAAKLGPVALDGFVMYQTGDELYAPIATVRDVNAYAAQVAAKATMGPGALRAALLYTSGDDGKDLTESNAFQNIQSGTTSTNFNLSASAYYTGDMMMLMRSKWAMDSDKAIVGSSNNGNMGLMFAAVGYDINFTPKLSATANVGFARASDTVSGSNYIGTEFNAQVNYKLYDNLMASAQGAYVALGERFETAASEPDNPYMGAIMLNYTF